MKKLVAAALLFLVTAPMAQAVADVLGMRTWAAPDGARVVFDLSAPAEYHLFRLENPERVVIDFRNTRLRHGLSRVATPEGAPVRSVRHAVHNDRDLRIVIDMDRHHEAQHFLLAPNEQYGHRLVVDLTRPGAGKRAQARAAEVRRAIDVADGERDIVIAIDPGHGGEDPGAQGASGLREKDVVLAIGRHLKTLIDREPGMRAVMIRDGDYFVRLRERTQKAREHRADLFVSIHADAFHDRRVRGSSLYVLSQNGASSEAARWLAARENASDLVGGVSLEDKDNVLASVLLDLSQSATLEASHVAAQSILQRMRPLGKVHRASVQQAGFAVLKSPDIPSILIETAFISNPDDESRLRNPQHQREIAKAVFDGIRDYFSRNPPAGTLYASRREHIISRGDTLSGLAQQYRVSVERLRSANQLESDVLRIGQVIRIPGG